MSEELKPCPNPWCTSTTAALPVRFQGGIRTGGWRVICGCGVRTHKYATEAEVIAAWNRRAAHPEADVSGVVKAILPLRELYAISADETLPMTDRAAALADIGHAMPGIFQALAKAGAGGDA